MFEIKRLEKEMENKIKETAKTVDVLVQMQSLKLNITTIEKYSPK